jgi:hypothetical protein
MKSIMFQDLRSCSVVTVYLRENAACLLSLLFEFEDGGNTFNRNVINVLPGYIASYLGNCILHFILFFRYITLMEVLSRSALLCIGTLGDSDYVAMNDKMIIENDELKRMSKEAVVT